MVGSTDYGPWAPESLDSVVRLFEGSDLRWWISGGLALELHTGATWRPHDDIDVSVLRRDVPKMHTLLQGWDIHVAADGVLAPWSGDDLASELSQNNMWCRRSPDGPWGIDIIVGDGDDDRWVYRRDRSVWAGWGEAVLHSPDGIPYLAPELQLLFKSKTVRPKDQVDAERVIPAIESMRRDRLGALLDPDHAWHRLIRDSAGVDASASSDKN